MVQQVKTDICVIGAGSAGLSVAAGAVQMGADVVLIEHGRMGGDCLNYGCVPSKSLLAAARMAHGYTQGEPFGVSAPAPEVDFARAMARVHEVIAAIAPHDSEERFTRLGVKVIREQARFTSEEEVKTENFRVRARRFVLATGSSPMTPPIDGLDRVSWLTNETVFDLKERPADLLIIGGGPIGIELAQAFCRLGSDVTVIELARCLPQDDPKLSRLVLQRLETEGVKILEKTQADRVSTSKDTLSVAVKQNDKQHTITGTHLLVAAGRKPNTNDLNLEGAGVECSKKGVTVDHHLRTTNKRIYACGDVAGQGQFTHLAGYQAGIVIRNCVLRWPAKADYKSLPWVTYTDPELAHTGLTEHAANEQGREVETVTVDISENDRARTDGIKQGLMKLVVDKRAKVLGAGICAPHAGELIAPWVLAVERGLKLKDMAGLMLPYPTLSESGKRAAGEYYTPIIYGKRMRKLVKLLQRLPV